MKLGISWEDLQDLIILTRLDFMKEYEQQYQVRQIQNWGWISPEEQLTVGVKTSLVPGYLAVDCFLSWLLI
jgi:hypothetical protein